MGEGNERYYKRDFWLRENLNYAQPHFRLQKSARIINRTAAGKECDLLDIGCGPATLMGLLQTNIHYYGLDIAIHNPAANLLESDFIETAITFGEKQFDIIVAQGVFEYVGRYQFQKFREIERLLNQNGTFIVSYVNFKHVNKWVYPIYNNIQSLDNFSSSLARVFQIDSFFPTSHHWRHHEPNRQFLKNIQMDIRINIPLISRLFGIEYFFICSSRRSRRA